MAAFSKAQQRQQKKNQGSRKLYMDRDMRGINKARKLLRHINRMKKAGHPDLLAETAYGRLPPGNRSVAEKMLRQAQEKSKCISS